MKHLWLLASVETRHGRDRLGTSTPSGCTQAAAGRHEAGIRGCRHQAFACGSAGQPRLQRDRHRIAQPEHQHRGPHYLRIRTPPVAGRGTAGLGRVCDPHWQEWAAGIKMVTSSSSGLNRGSQGLGRVRFRGATMPNLATQLQLRVLDRPVIDQSGLKVSKPSEN